MIKTPEKEDFNSYPISPFLNELSIVPDFFIQLQKTSKTFSYNDWDEKVKLIPPTISRKQFLYIFVKMNKSKIYSIYIGKSKTLSLNRIFQHIKGLSSQHIEKQNNSRFYMRFYSQFFESSPDAPIFLILYNWSNKKTISNLFSFPLSVSLSNAEALLISRLSRQLKDLVINHEFVGRARWKEFDKSRVKSRIKEILDIMGKNNEELWHEFCNFFFSTTFEQLQQTKLEQKISKINHIPLFTTDNSSKRRINIELNRRNNSKKILARSIQMKMRVQETVKVVENCYNHITSMDPKEIPAFTDGLIYMVYILRSDIIKCHDLEKKEQLEEKLKSIPPNSEIIPLYIGKTEMLGRNGGFSANLKGVAKGNNLQYFARWGSDDARHIGGMSLMFFNIPNRYPSTDYEQIIEIVFNKKERKNKNPVLDIPLYFQMKPWYPDNIDFSKLTGILTPEMEIYLISLARNLFDPFLANKHER